MNQNTAKLLELMIDGNYSKDLKKFTHLSEKEFLTALRDIATEGYNLGAKYYSDGTIGHYIEKECEAADLPFAVITRPDEKIIRIIVISDLHIGNIKDNPKYLELIYNYCITNGIHIIFNAGDLIDGKLTGNGPKAILNYKKQIKRAIHIHPQDKGITNFICLGNHDLDPLNSIGLDIQRFLLREREDLVPIGYGYGFIHIKNEQFLIKHKIKNLKIPMHSSSIVIHGHSHSNRIYHPDNLFKAIAYVASLSDVPMGNPAIRPGALDMNLTFNNNGYLENIDFKILNVDSKITLDREYNLKIDRHYLNTKTDISFEEDYKPKVLKRELIN